MNVYLVDHDLTEWEREEWEGGGGDFPTPLTYEGEFSRFGEQNIPWVW